MRRHSEATLMGLTKKELVEYVRMAEYNQDVAEESLKQQAENVKDWMPVVHGRWVTDGLGDGERICSMCKKYAIYTHRYRYEQYLTKYCPNCGARMDGE